DLPQRPHLLSRFDDQDSGAVTDRKSESGRVLAGWGVRVAAEIWGRIALRRARRRVLLPEGRPVTKIRVLVVDDSAFARKVLRQVLSRSLNIEVVGTAHDGLDALERIMELKPDVVTLDLVMPNLDGLGVLHALKKLEGVPVPR